MGNLIAIGVHCKRGDEVILERRTHSFVHEVAGGAAVFGVSFQPLDSPDGILSADQVVSAVRPSDIHEPISRLVVVENTANLAGGRVVTLARLREIRRVASERGLKVHMDGARVWNASLASGASLADYAREVDTLMCCLSKGLGCPVGSLVVGDRADVEEARRLRKMLGGGMRQVGVLAACGLHALEHHRDRLAEDHAAAKSLAAELRGAMDGNFRVQEPETNILLLHTEGKAATEQALEKFSRLRILALPLSDTCIRFVTHLDLPAGAAEEVGRRLRG
jgi:threonine aldolase